MQWLPIILLFYQLISPTSGQVPISNFYPYGSSAGDSQLAREDDDSVSIPIHYNFQFFNFNYREVYISTNGQINFGEGDSMYEPIPFPLNGSRSIASYWVDSDPSEGGDVHYREAVDQGLLDEITKDIRTHLVEYRCFTGQWAFIVTFEKVPAFDCGANPSSCFNPSCDETLTYQTILTSNGVQSFVIFLYNSLTYPVRPQSCINFAQIGFNAGDGRRFYMMPSSNTPSLPLVALTTSNVGVNGKWMFEVGGSVTCTGQGMLDAYPRKLLYFLMVIDLIRSVTCSN